MVAEVRPCAHRRVGPQRRSTSTRSSGTPTRCRRARHGSARCRARSSGPSRRRSSRENASPHHVDQARHRPGVAPALLPHVARHCHDLRRAVPRLHAGDDTQLGEPSESDREALDVHDLVPGVARPLRRRASWTASSTELMPRSPWRGRSTGNPGVQAGRRGRRARPGRSRCARGVGAVRIRLEHGRRVRLDDVVDVELDRADREPVVVNAAGAAAKASRARPCASHRVEQRGDQPDEELPLARARANSSRSVEEFCGSTTVVMPYVAAIRTPARTRRYCASAPNAGTTSRRAARPSRDSPNVA